ncbi:MAG: type II toxin-antitoxin system VapC family toxin [Methanobacteriota archaeon]
MIFERETLTHTKCLHIFKCIEEYSVEIWVPKICIIEVAAVSRRFTDLQTSQKITARLHTSSTLISEDDIFTIAWNIAETQSCSGFDSYFIALAYLQNIPLFTDDEGMHRHALKKNVKSILVRKAEISDIDTVFQPFS